MNIIKTIAMVGLAGLTMTSCTGKKQEAAPKEELPIVEGKVSFTIKPFEIKTILVKFLFILFKY